MGKLAVYRKVHMERAVMLTRHRMLVLSNLAGCALLAWTVMAADEKAQSAERIDRQRLERECSVAGTAWMDTAGTIHVQFVSYDPVVRAVAHGQLEYPLGHREYNAILSHIGPLTRGADPIPVRPWPSKDDEECAPIWQRQR
jgi:hypothetical protein